VTRGCQAEVRSRPAISCACPDARSGGAQVSFLSLVRRLAHGRRGKCYGNAAAELFFSSLKKVSMGSGPFQILLTNKDHGRARRCVGLLLDLPEFQ